VLDRLTPIRRSENMRRIRSCDTKPELIVRSMVHRLGFRFRLHRKDLPGKPDIVFVSARKIILVHGCFWHLHERCADGRIPKSQVEYWRPKLLRNVQRDERARLRLRKLGWKVLVVWECQVRDLERLTEKVKRFLSD